MNRRQKPLLGELEHLVLLAVLRLDGEGYGTSLRRELEGRAGRSVAVGALYATLERLEEKGYVRGELGEPTPERGGRSKRYYRTTAAGKRALSKSRAVLESMWEGLALEGRP